MLLNHIYFNVLLSPECSCSVLLFIHLTLLPINHYKNFTIFHVLFRADVPRAVRSHLHAPQSQVITDNAASHSPSYRVRRDHRAMLTGADANIRTSCKNSAPE